MPHIVTDFIKPYQLNFSEEEIDEKKKWSLEKAFVFPCQMFLYNIDKILISVYILNKGYGVN